MLTSGMKDRREVWYDPVARVVLTRVDVTRAAQTLARGHLAGPTSAHVLAEALASVALLGAETSEPEEVVSLQMKCDGPLGGFSVECTADGKLRGYTEKKILDDFDGCGAPDEEKLFGLRQIQVTHSIPGKILSQGLSSSLDDYFTTSLQRRARVRVAAAVTDEVEVLMARGVSVEILPDAPASSSAVLTAFERVKSLALSSRALLDRLACSRAVRQKTTPLAFGCRCSAERARTILAALPAEERATLPPTVSITCHMCGRLYSIPLG